MAASQYAATTHAERRPQPSRAADIIAIGDNPTLAVYLGGLFRRSGWTVASTRTCAEAMAFLRTHRAAVAVCEAALPHGRWNDVAEAFRAIEDAPALIVIGCDESLAHAVREQGGFDALIRPLRESDVVWSVASAWHFYHKGAQENETGGHRCSGA